MRILHKHHAHPSDPGQRGAALLLSFLVLIVILMICYQVNRTVSGNQTEANRNRILTSMEWGIDSILLQIHEDLKADAEGGGAGAGAAPADPLDAGLDGAEGGEESSDPVDSKMDDWATPDTVHINDQALRILIVDEDSKFNVLGILNQNEDEAEEALDILRRVLDFCREDTAHDIDSSQAAEMAQAILTHLKSRKDSLLPMEERLSDPEDEQADTARMPTSLREFIVLEPFEEHHFKDFFDVDGNRVHSIEWFLTCYTTVTTKSGAASGGGFAVNVNTAPRAVLAALFDSREVDGRLWAEVIEYRNTEDERIGRGRGADARRVRQRGPADEVLRQPRRARGAAELRGHGGRDQSSDPPAAGHHQPGLHHLRRRAPVDAQRIEPDRRVLFAARARTVRTRWNTPVEDRALRRLAAIEQRVRLDHPAHSLGRVGPRTARGAGHRRQLGSMARRKRTVRRASQRPGFDPVRLEVFHHLFAAVAEEMGIALQRAAFSPNIKERRDFSCALFSAGGEAVAQAAHVPVHLGSAPLSLAATRNALDLAQGDVAVLNDPYEGGTHLPDITLVAPVFLTGRQGADFHLVSRAHHADVGGMHPGSMAPAPDVHGEGLRIPPIRLVRAGQVERDVLRLLLANMRVPAEREADLLAQWAALRVGATRLQSMADEHGARTIVDRGSDLIDWTEALTRTVLDSLPQQALTFEDTLELADWDPVTLRLTMTARKGRATFDFTGTDDQVAAPRCGRGPAP